MSNRPKLRPTPAITDQRRRFIAYVQMGLMVDGVIPDGPLPEDRATQAELATAMEQWWAGLTPPQRLSVYIRSTPGSVERDQDMIGEVAP